MGYFTVQTQWQELADAETFAQLSEDEKRLIDRAQLSFYNRRLAETAHEAGVLTPAEYAAFADFGYKGLYNGLIEKTFMRCSAFLQMKRFPIGWVRRN
jgi:DNA-damage-inducible protein D